MDKCNPHHPHNTSPPVPSKKDPTAPHDFDRKDLFTQHVRRMHVTTVYGPDGDAGMTKFEKTQAEEAVQQRCHIKVRDLPPETLCGFCNDGQIFERWDLRQEHVGRHLENYAGTVGDLDEAEDTELKDWLIGENLLRYHSRTGWRIVGLKGGVKYKQQTARQPRIIPRAMRAEPRNLPDADHGHNEEREDDDSGSSEEQIDGAESGRDNVSHDGAESEQMSYDSDDAEGEYAFDVDMEH